MNATEAGKLLAILSAVDRREVDVTTAQGWAWALNDVPYERAVQAAHNAITAGVRYVDVLAIRAQLKAMQPDLERDVRSAKARGIIELDWDPRRPLTGELEARLRAAQASDWEQSNDRPEELAPDSLARPLGVALRSPDHASAR